MGYKEPTVEQLRQNIFEYRRLLTMHLAMVGWERMTDNEKNLLKTLLQDADILYTIAREEVCLTTISIAKKEI